MRILTPTQDLYYGSKARVAPHLRVRVDDGTGGFPDKTPFDGGPTTPEGPLTLAAMRDNRQDPAKSPTLVHIGNPESAGFDMWDTFDNLNHIELNLASLLAGGKGMFTVGLQFSFKAIPDNNQVLIGRSVAASPEGAFFRIRWIDDGVARNLADVTTTVLVGSAGNLRWNMFNGAGTLRGTGGGALATWVAGEKYWVFLTFSNEGINSGKTIADRSGHTQWANEDGSAGSDFNGPSAPTGNADPAYAVDTLLIGYDARTEQGSDQLIVHQIRYYDFGDNPGVGNAWPPQDDLAANIADGTDDYDADWEREYRPNQSIEGGDPPVPTPLVYTTFDEGQFLKKVSFGTNVDSDATTATVTLLREQESESLAPLMTLSPLNPGGEERPAVDIGRVICIEVALVPFGTAPIAADWILMFEGQIDEIDWAGSEMVLRCRDKIHLLMDTFNEDGDKEYSTWDTPELLEDMVVELLDDVLSQFSPALRVRSAANTATTGARFGAVEPSRISVLDQINTWASAIGWRCRYRFANDTDQFDLFLFEPGRRVGFLGDDRTFTDEDHYSITQLSRSIQDVRNAITVQYNDGVTLDPDGKLTKFELTVTDDDSIAKYGRRFGGFTEQLSNGIDSAVEADLLANAALEDLKEPQVVQTVVMPFWHAVQLGDRYTFSADGSHYDVDVVFSVTGWKHTLGDRRYETVVEMRRFVTQGFVDRWRGLFGDVGISPVQTTFPGQVVALQAEGNASGWFARWRVGGGRPVERFEVHLTASGVQPVRSPVSTTFALTTTNIAAFVPIGTAFPAGTYDVHVIAINNGFAADPVTIADVTAP